LSVIIIIIIYKNKQTSSNQKVESKHNLQSNKPRQILR